MSYRIGERVKRDKRTIKKYVIGVIALAFPLTIALSGGAAMAHDNGNFTGNNLDASQCKPGTKIVDVNFKLTNDYDSAVGGSAWANDTINRELKIWNTGENNYCAIVQDQGSFVTFTGPSPNGTGSVGAGINGDMDGGYRTVSFAGVFVGNANYNTHGNLGTFNLACTDANNCPGEHPSFAKYFSDVDANNVGLAWWGWEYNTCQNGSWVNEIVPPGNAGDITGNASRKDKCHEDNDHHDNDGHHDNDKHHHDDGNHHHGHHEDGDRGPEE